MSVDLLDDLYEAIVTGDAEQALAHTESGLAMALAPTDLLYGAMIPALEEVGRLFESGEYFLPEMLVSARAMQAAMDRLRPHIVEAGVKPLGRFVMGTVAGDIHDIGKNLCNVMLEGAGFEVIDLGINVPGDRFVEAITVHRPLAVGMSAFLTTTMSELATNIRLIEEAGVRDGVTIMVGGAPIDQDYADRIGADGFAPDASSAVRVVKQLLGL